MYQRRGFSPLCLSGVLAFLLLALSAQARIIYVNQLASTNPPPDGLTWPTAFPTIGAGLLAAQTNDQVWVAAGLYYELITLPDGIALYGGFLGSETQLEQRDWLNHLTILDGNRGGTVVTVGIGATNTTRIDGLNIRNGGRNGIACLQCSPVIANNRVSQNKESGVSCLDSYATITNNLITGNSYSGIRCERGAPIILHNRIFGNVSSSGGGVFCSLCSPEIAFNWIAGNHSTVIGGGILCGNSSSAIHNNRIIRNIANDRTWSVLGGGINCWDYSAPLIFNNEIIGNYAVSSRRAGGGIWCSPQSTPKIYNNTLARNFSRLGGAISCASTSTVEMVNNVFAFGNSGIEASGPIIFRNNCVYGNLADDFTGLTNQVGTNGNFSSDPRLIETGVADDLLLLPDSPCRDAGDVTVVQPDWVDLENQPRIQGAGVDVGAYESEGLMPALPAPVVVRVSPTGDDRCDGATWASAKRTVQAGLDAAGWQGGQVWVQAGVYYERIQLRPFVRLYGGFRGDESQLVERDGRAHPTILDGEQAGSVVTSGFADVGSEINGFVIRNGRALRGGGIYADTSPLRISNNVISNNLALQYGGGIMLTNRFPYSPDDGDFFLSNHCVIANNQIVGNRVAPTNSIHTSGGGIALANAAATVIGNLIADNQVIAAYSTDIYRRPGGTGSGIESAGGLVLIANNTLMRNVFLQTNGPGGALNGNDNGSTIANNILVFNSSGVRLVYCPTQNRTRLLNNCIFGNGTNYVDAADVTGTNGNLSVDPLLDPSRDGARLLPGSPCIDAGNDSVVQPDSLDLDGLPRMAGAHVDIGAAEFRMAPELRLTLAVAPSQGPAVLRLACETGRHYVFELSTNLSDWLPLSTNLATGAALEFTDRAGDSDRVRFYRAKCIVAE
jgi:hypothetical protein